MPDRLIELAIEALESKKAAIDAEIAALRRELRPARSRRQVRGRRVGKKSRISAAGRKALSERMTARWAKWRAERGKKGRNRSRRQSLRKRKSLEIKDRSRNITGSPQSPSRPSGAVAGQVLLPGRAKTKPKQRAKPAEEKKS